ncbi:hypothetical protein MOUN0_K02212 [Monosporozyma unispora]|nr:hypothetical protein C6P44_004189 [Kazachstania unispora]
MDEISIHTHSSIITRRKYVVAQEITTINNQSEMLTRSISSGAITQMRARSGSIVSQTSRVTASSSAIHRHELRRTLSNRSLTLPSPIIQSNSIKRGDSIYDDSLDQFIGYIEGKEDSIGEETRYYEKMNELWESLPQSTKDIFISRALKKRGEDIEYDDIKNMFPGDHVPSKNGFTQYRKRIGPYLRRDKKLDEATISKIVSDMYWGELKPSERRQLKEEASRQNGKFINDRLQMTKKFVNTNLSNKSLKKDPILSQLTVESRVNRIKSMLEKMNSQSKKFLNKLSNKKKNKSSGNETHPPFQIAI